MKETFYKVKNKLIIPLNPISEAKEKYALWLG